MALPKIEALQQEGRWVSSGNFSLDSQRARSILGNYALPEKAMYALKLVQWAVAAGASLVELGIQGQRVWCRHDGEACSPERLEALLSFSVAPQSRCERHLQVALATLLTLNPQEIVLVDGQLTVTGARIQRFSAAARSVYGLLTMDIGINTLWDLFSHAGRSEVALLRTHCEGGSVPVWVNGFCVNRPSFGLASWATRRPDGSTDLAMAERQQIRKGYFFLNREPQPFSFPAPACAWNKGARWNWSDASWNPPLQVSHAAPILTPAKAFESLAQAPKVSMLWHGLPMLSADLGISWNEGALEKRHRLYHYYDGVLVARSELPVNKGTWRTFTACPGLTLDAGGLGVVRDEQWNLLHGRVARLQQSILAEG